MPYEAPDELRAFLRLCLDPGPGRDKRTPARLVEVLPPPLHDEVIRHAPHLRPMRHRVDALAEQQKAAHQEYADALAGWIRGEEPSPARKSLPLLEAVAVAYEAATQHIDDCATCRPDMRLAEMCPDGQSAAVSGLDAVPTAATECAHDEDDEVRTVAGLVLVRRCRHCGERLEAVVEPECAHLAWEVTSEYRNTRQLWVKSRKCADCGDRLESAVEPEPHWPDKALSACPGFEGEYQGEGDAKRRLPNCKYCRQPRAAHPETESENDR